MYRRENGNNSELVVVVSVCVCHTKPYMHLYIDLCTYICIFYIENLRWIRIQFNTQNLRERKRWLLGSQAYGTFCTHAPQSWYRGRWHGSIQSNCLFFDSSNSFQNYLHECPSLLCGGSKELPLTQVWFTTTFIEGGPFQLSYWITAGFMYEWSGINQRGNDTWQSLKTCHCSRG